MHKQAKALRAGAEALASSLRELAHVLFSDMSRLEAEVLAYDRQLGPPAAPPESDADSYHFMRDSGLWGL